MHVRIDEARQHSLAFQIDLARLRSRELGRFGVAAGGDDAIAPNRDGIDNVELRVHGDDFAVVENQIGRLSVGRGCQDEESKQECAKGHVCRISNTARSMVWALGILVQRRIPGGIIHVFTQKFY